MDLVLRSRMRRSIEVLLPAYSLAVVFFYFRPDYLPWTPASFADSMTPWAVWAGMALMSGLLAVSGMVLAFFLLYSPLYLATRSLTMAHRSWVDRRELRFYTACFILLLFLGGLAVWHPVMAGTIFVLMAGSAHLLWRALA
jgi:hypothetical protein